MDEYQEKKIEYAKSKHSEHRRTFSELNQATINAGHRAVQALLVLNGGAAIASLGFIASLAGSDGVAVRLESFAWPLTMFGWGAGLAVLTAGFAYFVAFCHVSALARDKLNWEFPVVERTGASERWTVLAIGLTISAWAFATASLATFGFGIYGIRAAIL